MNDSQELVHEGLTNPGDECVIVQGYYKYYHYKCDNFNDVGWGCGYRTTQTICSWIRDQKLQRDPDTNVPEVPTLLEIQNILVKCEDKPSNFIASKQWIGCFESSLIIDTLYDVPCKIIHSSAFKITEYLKDIWTHFETVKCPIMMGGDLDNASKGILGIARKDGNYFLLIADPHCTLHEPTKQQLQSEGWIKWFNVKCFSNSSFYNFCLPQFK